MVNTLSVKEELAHIKKTGECCALAELYAYALGDKCADEMVHKRQIALIKKLSHDPVAHECCKGAFLRGAFLLCGVITPPEKGYHLEFSIKTPEFAYILQEQLNSFGFHAKIVHRRTNFVVYIKESEKILEFLSRVKAHSAVLQLTDTILLKEIRNQANRAANCDEANVSKTLDAAFAQLSAIHRIDETVGLHSLPEPLRVVAELRLKNPEATLSELCDLYDGEITKSGMNHRFRKILSINENKGE